MALETLAVPDTIDVPLVGTLKRVFLGNFIAFLKSLAFKLAA
jgi:hypothetical protein